MRVLDVGSGSGILALAAVKLGAANVYCIDNSSVAVGSALANTAMNYMSDRVNVVLGVLDETETARLSSQYDLVLANIIARVIGSIASNLAQVLAPGGILITGGIIEDRRHEAEEPLLAADLKLIDQVMIDDWVTLILQK
jgi:ribosomal protein L11 methyltransferase